MDAGVVRTPRWPVLATCVTALIAAGAAFVSLRFGSPIILALLGYVSGCIAAVAAAGAHRAAENKRRSHPDFRPEPVLGRTARIAMVIAIAGGLACAVALAMEVAK